MYIDSQPTVLLQVRRAAIGLLTDDGYHKAFLNKPCTIFRLNQHNSLPDKPHRQLSPFAADYLKFIEKLSRQLVHTRLGMLRGEKINGFRYLGNTK